MKVKAGDYLKLKLSADWDFPDFIDTCHLEPGMIYKIDQVQVSYSMPLMYEIWYISLDGKAGSLKGYENDLDELFKKVTPKDMARWRMKNEAI